jgi:proline iminopeptidase
MWTRLFIALALVVAPGCIDDRALVPPTVDEDPSLPHLEVNGTNLHMTEMGPKGAPMIVFLHGGPGGDYRPYLEWAALADRYHLVMYDQRGAGLSRRENKATLTVDTSLADLEAVIAATRQGQEPVVLFTHSWGGTLATAYINEDPTRVRGLVLAEPPGFTRAEFEDFYRKAFGDLHLTEGVDDILWSAPFLSPEEHARWDYVAFAQNRTGDQLGGNDRVHPEPAWRWGAALSYWMPQQIGEFDWTSRLSEVKFPVLWFHSEKNQVANATQQAELAKHFPQVEMHLVEGVGHDLLYQRQEELLPLVEDYLARVTKEQIP